MILAKPVPFDTAIRFARAKRVMPTGLNSAQLRELDSDLKRRAWFSAATPYTGYLSRMGELATVMAGGLEEEGRMISPAEAAAQLKEYLGSLGYRPGENEAGTIKDLSSFKRRHLIVETNLLDTMNAGRWKDGQDKIALEVNPAWELIRMIEPKGAPRDWEERWLAARAATTAEGSTDPRETGGRMVALKNHPIWQALGDGAGGYEDALGNPWAPFAFNSGMNTIDVGREEAVALGLLNEDTRIEPEDRGMNEGLEADTGRFQEALLKNLEANDDIEMEDGILRLANVIQRVFVAATEDLKEAA